MPYAMTSRSASLGSSRPSALETLAYAFAVYRQRRALARLSADQLADIGITKDQAIRESKRAFWDISAA